MNRKSRKEISTFVRTELEKDKTRKEIQTELYKKYDEKSKVDQLIARIPDPKKRERFKLLNYILLALLFLSLIANIYTGSSYLAEKPIQAIIALIITLALFAYFIHGIAIYKGNVYYEIILIVAISLILSLRSENLWIWDIVDLTLTIMLAGLAYFLGKKMFPNYGLNGLKKDKKGDYRLE